MQQSTLSVILRLHTIEGDALHFLSNALLSLAGAIYTPIEAIVVTQQFLPLQIQKVEELLARFVWKDSSYSRVVNYANPEKKDHRSALLNKGFDAALGRYLAILDYDDYVYEHGYSTLIKQLERSSSAVAFGGCQVAHAKKTKGCYYVMTKSSLFADKHPDHFYTEDIHPCHSFVVDKQKLPFLPRFNEEMSRHENYYWLLKLRTLTTFDVTMLSTVLCEYSIRDDGAYSTINPDIKNAMENLEAWEKSKTILDSLRLSPDLQWLKNNPRAVLADRLD